MTYQPPTDVPPPPRQLRRRPGRGCATLAGLWFIRLFIMPHTLVGIYLLGAAIFAPFVYFFGTDAPGNITRLDTSRGKRGSVNYYVHYTYVVNGVEYQGSQNVSSDVYGTLKVGEPYPVRVFTLTPTWTPFPRGPGSSAGNLFLWPIMALFWNGILSVFLWMAWIAPWRLRSLQRHGLATKGVIIGTETRRGNKGSVSYIVRYRYELTLADDGFINADPETFEREMTVTAADCATAVVDQPVTVIYDPKKPKRSLIYEFAEYEAVS